MLGARTSAGTAVGSRPKLNTVSTRAVNTAADSTAVRVRNSSTRSLRATTHAAHSSSAIDHGAPIGLGDLAGPARAARRELDEPPTALERDVRRELDALVHIVRRHDEHPAAAPHLHQHRPHPAPPAHLSPPARLPHPHPP